jgi:hypothetical protein
MAHRTALGRMIAALWPAINAEFRGRTVCRFCANSRTFLSPTLLPAIAVGKIAVDKADNRVGRVDRERAPPAIRVQRWWGSLALDPPY